MIELDRFTVSQRKTLFALAAAVFTGFVVVAFATTGPTSSRGDQARRSGAPASPPPAAGAASAVVEGRPNPAPPPVDVASMAAAKRVAGAFVAAYASYRPDDDAARKAAQLRPLVTPDLAAKLAGGSSGAAQRQRLAAAGETAVTTVEAVQVESLTPGGLELLVVARQDLTGAAGSRQRRPTYRVVVVQSGPGWLVAAVSA